MEIAHFDISIELNIIILENNQLPAYQVEFILAIQFTSLEYKKTEVLHFRGVSY